MGPPLRTTVKLVSAFVVFLGSFCYAQQPDEDAADDAGLPFTISRETTYLTEPLLPNGQIAYIAALNAITSEGVTPENNSAVLFHKAIGRGDVLPEEDDLFFGALGMPPPSDTGKYFIDFQLFAIGKRRLSQEDKQAVDALRAANDKALSGDAPWSRDEFPLVGQWLDANAEPLGLVIEASRQTRRFHPVLPDLSLCSLNTFHYRVVARALQARAMMYVGTHDASAAWSDLLAIYRLGRLVRQGGSSVEQLSGIAIQSLAVEGTETLLSEIDVSPQFARRLIQDLDELDIPPSVGETIGGIDRLLALDAIQQGAINGKLDNFAWGDEISRRISMPWHPGLEWDRLMRDTNQLFDEIVRALACPTRAERISAINDIEQKFEHANNTTPQRVLSYLSGPRKASTDEIGSLLLGDVATEAGKVQSAHDRAQTEFELARIAIALAWYRAEHASYPANLAGLVPDYLKKIPNDLYTDDPLVYSASQDGFAVYSLGPNLKDDSGKTFDETRSFEYDIALKVSRK